MPKSRFWTDKDGYDSVWLDKNDLEDFAVDFTRYLDGDTISSAAVTSEDGVTISSVSNTSTKVTFWLNAPQSRSDVTIQVTTAAGRLHSHTVRAYERER